MYNKMACFKESISWTQHSSETKLNKLFKYLPAYHGTIWSDEVNEKTKAVLNQFLEDSPLKSIIVHFSPWYHIWFSKGRVHSKKKKFRIFKTGGGSGQTFLIFQTFLFSFFHVLIHANLQRNFFSIGGTTF